MNIVTIQNLKKYYGKGENQVKALDGIDLSIEKGKFTAIIGASGSGKTTLLNMIGALDRPDEGEVIVDGVRLSGMKERELAVFRRNKVGFVYQNFNLIPTLTVRENILFPLSLSGNTPDTAFFSGNHPDPRPFGTAGCLSGTAFRRRTAADGHRPGAHHAACADPCRRTDGKSGFPKRPERARPSEAYRGNLASDTHHDHTQSGAGADGRPGSTDRGRAYSRIMAFASCRTPPQKDGRIPVQ